jgi:signal transduction histidine kinase/HPt (histidine-containing phosphotransfer) domain-containing protein
VKDAPTQGEMSLHEASAGRLLWLFGVFFVGLLLVVGLKIFFADLYTKLEQRSENERARLFIGEEIVRGIRALETDVYRLASAGNAAELKRIRKNINAQIGKLENDLGVLKQGGLVRREIYLNIEGRDEMVREVSYSPGAEDSAYVMEVIEIAPLLDVIRARADELEQMLMQHWEVRERGDRNRFFLLEGEISTFVKHIPPLFFRVNENANRLFFDSSERLRTIEAELAEQRQHFKVTEWALVALVVALASVAGLLFVRQINDTNRKLRLAWEDMRAAKEEAERASRAKSDFVSRMSHELRTPMNAILGFAQLLEGEELQASHQNYVSLINRSGQHLLELINQVLDHAKIEAGRLTLENLDYDFREAIAEVSAIVSERASAKGLQFIAEIAPDLPRRLMGDPTRLRQVLINLTANAVKFTESGTVKLRIAPDGERLFFSIRDTGIGMDAAARKRLFQPFGQADESITRKYGGTGLGLIISRELVQAMGGDIEVDSAPGVGSCFSFSLPLRQPAVAAEAAVYSADNALVVPSGVSEGDTTLAELVDGTILLVDDNRVNLVLGAAMLSKKGLVHDSAANGMEALQRLDRKEYVLILMDMEMPVMDGLTATMCIREREQSTGGHVPIIAMTANALQGDRERCFEAGMDGYISKPINLAALEQEFRRVMGLASVARSAPASSSRLPALDGLQVYDRKAALDRLGDADLLGELVAMFVADYPRNIGDVESALAGGDWQRLRREAHTMKGLLATFCAHRAEAWAKALEAAAATSDEAECTMLAGELRREADTFVAALAGA